MKTLRFEMFYWNYSTFKYLDVAVHTAEIGCNYVEMKRSSPFGAVLLGYSKS